jgi:hypothetical protein
MNRISFFLSGTLAFVTACGAPLTTTDSGPMRDSGPAGVIGATYVLPSSIPALAEEVRRGGGQVLLMETVSTDARGFTSIFPTGISDLYERYPTVTMTVRVVDALGEDAPSTFTIETIAGPVELVNERGDVRTDWVVSGSAPAAMRLPPTEGRWVFFGSPSTTGLSRLRQVARVEGETVSGEFFSSRSSVPLDTLRH